MNPDTQKNNTILNLALYIVIAGLIGSIFDYSLELIIIALTLYLFYLLKNMFQLHNWLLDRSQEPPDAKGYWGEIFNEIHLMEKIKRKNQDKLNKVLSRFQNAAQALPYGAIILTKYNHIEWANQIACTMLGINPDSDVGQKISNLVRHPKFNRYLEKKKYSNYITIPRPDQTDHQLEIQVIPFGSNQKLILCRDVTHVINLEVMRTRFISNVSHELRSPLTVIKGYMEMLVDDDSIQQHQDLQLKVFHNMSDQVNRMDRLVSDLLTLTRLETESIKMNKEINIPSMLSAIRDNAIIFGKDKNQTITLETNDELRLIGDHDELTSLFTNLTNNAVRYTPEEGDIKICWYLENDQAIFRVSDTGPGIAPEHLAHLTERFYRVDNDRSRETGGTGLGLSIVKHVLDRHDGELKIESTPGQGSTFTCSFPKQRVIIPLSKRVS